MIDVIYPDKFKPFPGIKALFTLSNRDISTQNDVIAGLNFGINTADSSTVIDQNRCKLADVIDVDPDLFVIAEQIHGDHIEVVEQPGLYRKTDGLITKNPNLILTIQVADCAAVMVADTENRIIGIFHAGWRGAANNIVSKGVKTMKSMARKDPHYTAYISPCISERNFEVGYEVAERFPAKFVDYTSYKKPHINLKSYLKAELVNAGVQIGLIEISDECTMDDTRFYSYRREREKAGRMLGCMYMNEKFDSICE